MTDVVKRRRDSKTERKGDPNIFHFCDLMCNGLEIKETQKGEALIPVCLEDEKNEFILMCWNFWRCFISALKKELPVFLAKEEIALTCGKMLFSLFHENNSYFFLIHQSWVAEKLGIPSRTSFVAENPTDAFNQLRFLCLSKKKKNPEIQSLQKIFAVINSLPLPERCQLNLLLSAGSHRRDRKKQFSKS